MKLFFKKILVFGILSIFLHGFLFLTASAQDAVDGTEDPEAVQEDTTGQESSNGDTEPTFTYDDATINLFNEMSQVMSDIIPCFTPEESSGYMITPIEEPLETKDQGNFGDDFVSRICFRNVFRYVDANGVEHRFTEPNPANDCSESGKAAFLDDLENGGVNSIAFSCKKIQVLFSRGGTSTLEAYIAVIYRWGASLAGLIAVAVIILSGIQISLSTGDSAAVESAKTRIMQSIAGLVVLLISGLILYTINPNFFVR